MKAMILAAGSSSRLGTLGQSIAKPMLPFLDKPLLEYVIYLLVQHGFNDVMINLFHLADSIKNHFGNGTPWRVNITYSLETQLLGTAGAVTHVAEHFDKPFLVYYGDNLTNVDLSDLWESHQSSNALATIGLIKMHEPTTRGIVGLNKNGNIDRLIEKPSKDQIFDDYWVNSGCYIVEPELIRHIPKTVPVDFSRDVFPSLIANKQILRGHPLKGQLLSTDTPQRYKEALSSVMDGSFILPPKGDLR
ncbi:MAG: nucleotidyltransferase family protein [Candidatus Latescibacterota bacterium]|nr:nucleotidyltransferase family protein [Candidatus Latescibacterota bacterium]